jgi:hypothetical protein
MCQSYASAIDHSCSHSFDPIPWPSRKIGPLQPTLSPIQLSKTIVVHPRAEVGDLNLGKNMSYIHNLNILITTNELIINTLVMTRLLPEKEIQYVTS